MRVQSFILPVLFVGACAAIATFAGESADRRAWTLEERRGAVRGIAIDVLESAPPQFSVRLEVDMPTPGWRLVADSVSRPDAEGRIVVLATGTGPDGIVPQVITPTTLRVALGSVDAGDYALDVRVRHGTGEYRREGCFLLEARARQR